MLLYHWCYCACQSCDLPLWCCLPLSCGSPVSPGFATVILLCRSHATFHCHTYCFATVRLLFRLSCFHNYHSYWYSAAIVPLASQAAYQSHTTSLLSCWLPLSVHREAAILLSHSQIISRCHTALTVMLHACQLCATLPLSRFLPPSCDCAAAIWPCRALSYCFITLVLVSCGHTTLPLSRYRCHCQAALPLILPLCQCHTALLVALSVSLILLFHSHAALRCQAT